eukprot:912531-Amphidinium_carterae.1
MVRQAFLLTFLLCIAAGAAELQRTKCNREDDGSGPDASVVVMTTKSEDEATVEFELHNLNFSFTLQARPVFTSDGVVQTVGAGGTETANPRNQRVQSYRVRDPEGALFARAVISDSGKVRGLFRDEQVWVYLEPSDSAEDQLEEGVLHNLYILRGSDLVRANSSSQQL